MPVRLCIILAAVLAIGGWLLLRGGEPGAAPAALAASAPAALAASAPAALAASAAPNQPDAPVVLELFTSQGCSSCPPADALAAQLAQRADVIVIARPVTYWDRLGWRDTLALPENTGLQRAYALRGLAGYNGVYTPQAVVDGRTGAVGSGREELAMMIAQAARRERPRLIVDAAAGTVAVHGAAAGAGGQGRAGPTNQAGRARLVLVGMRSRDTVQIGRGENGNRTLSYTNVYRGARDLGAWRGGEQVFALAAAPIAGADRYALVLRAGATGPILAAAKLSSVFEPGAITRRLEKAL